MHAGVGAYDSLYSENGGAELNVFKNAHTLTCLQNCFAQQFIYSVLKAVQ